jgi:hypothetical protein
MLTVTTPVEYPIRQVEGRVIEITSGNMSETSPEKATVLPYPDGKMVYCPCVLFQLHEGRSAPHLPLG